MYKVALFFCALSLSFNAHSMNLMGRLGMGLTNQVVTGIDALSFKLQRSRAMALGAIIGLDAGEGDTQYALGVKGYRIIYDEPQLNFYSAISAIMFTYPDDQGDIDNGHQIEGSFGTEFSFQGLESVGFSFEFGLGIINQNDTNQIKTIGHQVLTSAVHFYL